MLAQLNYIAQMASQASISIQRTHIAVVVIPIALKTSPVPVGVAWYNRSAARLV
jgi:hypothetical protein